MHNPAIVIAAYNRPHSLRRLLDSIGKAQFPSGEIALVISIDKSEVGEVEQLAKAFNWTFGEKRVLAHENHLGLKEHILKCGDLTKEYGSIILLEDDLVVAPPFYDYASKALHYYNGERQVAGISLYSYKMVESCYSPFQAIEDGSDVYFMQVPSSWGQAWTPEQWEGFRLWFKTHLQINKEEMIPPYVKEWSESSWKKHFFRYLIGEGKYFVYPRASFTSNFGDEGTNATTKGLYQVPLQMNAKEYQFKTYKESLAIYDAYFEMESRILNKLTNELSGYKYTVDTYGTREFSRFFNGYVLTVRKGMNPEKTYGLTMFPAILNIIYGVKGNELGFYKVGDLQDETGNQYYHYYPLESIAKYMCKEEIEKTADLWATERANDIAPVIANEIAEKKINEIAPIRAQELANDKFGAYVQEFHLNIDYPKISIVVPTYNNVKHLDNTIASIINQNYPNYELIVIDRGSTDGIYQMIKQYEKHLTHFSSDNSLTHFKSLQKGFEQCTGEYMSWLDPGSAFMNKAFWAVRNIFKTHFKIKWLTGIPTFFNNQGGAVVDQDLFSLRWTKDKLLASEADEIRRSLTGGNVFWRKSLWEDTGSTFDLDFEVLADVVQWKKFMDKETLYSVLVYLAEIPFDTITGKSQSNGKLSREMNLIKDGFSLPQKRWIDQQLDDIFYKSFRLDVPYLKHQYLKRNPMPEILRYDYESDSFYFSVY